MTGRRRSTHQAGFTLIEIITVVCIIGILAGLATALYTRSIGRAKAVEGETAVREVHRLELAYYGSHDSFTDDLSALGFSMGKGMKYYTVDVTLGGGSSPLSYQVTALPIGGSSADAWVLRQYQTGTTVVDRVAAESMGGDGSSEDPLGGPLPPSGFRAPTGPRTVTTPSSSGQPGGVDTGGGGSGGRAGGGAGSPGMGEGAVVR